MLMAAGLDDVYGVATDATALHVASTTPIASERAGTGPAVAAVASGSASTQLCCAGCRRALDDAVFYSIPEADRSLLAGACAAIAAIYEPPSTI
ncbi:unnamed protein product [Lampetra planeri]